jgi:hypothetical protein
MTARNENYMPEEILPPLYNRDANSTHRLSRMDLQRAIGDVKRFFEARLEEDLNIVKVRQSIPMSLKCNEQSTGALYGSHFSYTTQLLRHNSMRRPLLFYEEPVSTTN